MNGPLRVWTSELPKQRYIPAIKNSRSNTFVYKCVHKCIHVVCMLFADDGSGMEQSARVPVVTLD